MAKFLKLSVSLLLILGLFSPSLSFAQSKALTVVNESIRAMDGIQTLSARLKRQERIDGEYVKGDMEFKLKENPKKVYILNHAPEDGAEVIWGEGLNENKALVNPNKFMLGNMNLNIKGKILTKDQHHNLESVGFGKMNRIVKAALKKYGNDFDKYVKYAGVKIWNGYTCDVVEINYTDFKYETYTVKAGEDLWAIGKKLNLPEFRILELNDLRNFSDVKAGQTLKVPSVYAPKCTFYIEKKTRLPIVQIIEDSDGLYERYEYHTFKVNPKFEDIEFMPVNPEYGFLR